MEEEGGETVTRKRKSTFDEDVSSNIRELQEEIFVPQVQNLAIQIMMWLVDRQPPPGSAQPLRRSLGHRQRRL